jgi:nitrate/nitrite transport system substrate-binding protein
MENAATVELGHKTCKRKWAGHEGGSFEFTSAMLGGTHCNPISSSKDLELMDQAQRRSTASTPSLETQASGLSRRKLLQGAAGLAGLAVASRFPGFIPSAYAAEGPEDPNISFGFIALTDCSPLVIAHEKGLFKKYGINSTPVKPANWAAVRDALVKGDIQCTHMLLGMPIASSIGLGGAKPVKLVAPWILNRNGQAISLKTQLKGKVAGDPKALKPFVDEAKKSGTKMSFAMTFPPGTHAMWLRYYLAAGGIHPDKDVELITIPPPQMVQNMKVGKMDGFCVGEPWNARAIAEKVGFTSVATQEIWKDHPEKVLAFTDAFASKNPKTVKAILKAVHEASVWLDDLSNREEQCAIVSTDAYIKCNKGQILDRLLGKYDYGDGRTSEDPNYMIFSQRNCNYPQAAYCKWWLTQLRRWGMLETAPDYDAVASDVMQPQLYNEAMSEIGYQHGGEDDSAWTMFDGVEFKPGGDLEAYAKSFAVHNMKA